MTDYGQFYDDMGRLTMPEQVEKKPEKKKRCSGDTDVTSIIKWAKKLNKLRKEAAVAGVCLDELENVAKELAKEDI